MATVLCSEGKIARIRNGLLHVAVVQIEICFPAEKTSTIATCQGPDDWKQGAIAGIAYALATSTDWPCQVTVTKIGGTYADTNPTIVGGAAIQAFWSAMQYLPSPEQREYVDQLVFQSFSHPFDHLPEFHAWQEHPS